MGKCESEIKEVRFITEPELTHCYVLIHAHGDCPFGVQGWHHKVFPASVSAMDILEKHFSDYLLWGHEAPKGYANAN